MICPQCNTDNGSQGNECYRCGADLGPQLVSQGPAAGVFAFDKYLLNQKVLSFKDKYHVFDEFGNKLLYVEREAWKVMPKLHFFTDESKNVPVMSIMSKPKGFFDMGYKLHLVLPDGQPLAIFRKDWIRGMFFQRLWHVLDANGDVIGKAEEDSVLLGLIRRYLPFGEWIRTNFNIFLGSRQVGTFNRKFTIIDKYVLDLTQDHTRSLDRRIALGLCVLLDTAEKR